MFKTISKLLRTLGNPFQIFSYKSDYDNLHTRFYELRDSVNNLRSEYRSLYVKIDKVNKRIDKQGNILKGFQEPYDGPIRVTDVFCVNCKSFLFRTKAEYVDFEKGYICDTCKAKGDKEIASKDA